MPLYNTVVIIRTSENRGYFLFHMANRPLGALNDVEGSYHSKCAYRHNHVRVSSFLFRFSKKHFFLLYLIFYSLTPSLDVFSLFFLFSPTYYASHYIFYLLYLDKIDTLL